jgi:hypothetical protein
MFTNANTLVQKLGQGVCQSDVQTLLYNLDDMHRASQRIEEFIEFQKEIVDK